MKYFLIFSLVMIGTTLKAQEVRSFHDQITVVDGHNDVIITSIMEGRDIGKRMKTGHTDLPRLKEGGVDVQVFAVWSDDKDYKTGAFEFANKQIDALERVIKDNSNQIELAYNCQDIVDINGKGKIAAVIGIEGGNMIESSITHLDSLYRRGARYLTLTWNYNLPWVTAAAEEIKTEGNEGKGLNNLGRKIVKRMNELGMMIDLSHVGEKAFYDVLEVSSKPVLVSHSNAYSLTPVFRNLKDDQLVALKKNGGVVGVNFYSGFLDIDFEKRVDSLFASEFGDVDSVQHGKYQKLPPELQNQADAPIELLLQHVDYLVGKVGIDHVAIGSDFDGIESTPKGLDDVSKLPLLTSLLLSRGYSKDDVEKIMGLNFLRILRENEEIPHSSR